MIAKLLFHCKIIRFYQHNLFQNHRKYYPFYWWQNIVSRLQMKLICISVKLIP